MFAPTDVRHLLERNLESIATAAMGASKPEITDKAGGGHLVVD
jgi:hypothetical protein